MKEYFNYLISETEEYLKVNNLKSMVLGISGGIDSTVVAAICNEVNKRTEIPLIGRSLPIKNTENEFNVSKFVGKTFCNDFEVISLHPSYNSFLGNILETTDQTKIANGNIQARLRMIYLYNIAGLTNGIVMSTDNQTEYQLGFWTLHGDVGDFNPLFGLWKTEIYKLAEWLANEYYSEFTNESDALKQSINLIPTDGLGISNSDLEQIGAKSYDQVDEILMKSVDYIKNGADYDVPGYLSKKYPTVYGNVIERWWNSRFKREALPVYVKRNEKLL